MVAGLRVSEVLGLQVGDIDGRAETLQVERRQHRGDIDDPKSESSRRLRQVGTLAHELLRFAVGRGPEDFIFQRKDGRLLDDRDLQQHVFRPAAETAGIYFEGFGMQFQALERDVETRGWCNSNRSAKGGGPCCARYDVLVHADR